MVFRAGTVLLLAAAGAGAALAFTHGFWATFTGCLLLILLIAIPWENPLRRKPATADAGVDQSDTAMLPMLLDQLPTPLVRLETGTATAMNRAARQLFGTDDRIVPAPPELLSPQSALLRHEGRPWRIDRVQAPGTRFSIMALIDIEAESRAAEARASQEMIEILGHELLNGLAPIVSLAESAEQAMAQPDKRERLLPEILGTLSRRADGLMRFTSSYRALARLPQPVPVPIALEELAMDLQRQFSLKWGNRVALTTQVSADRPARADRDQLMQAIWALLNNGAEAAMEGKAPASLQLLFRLDTAALSIEVEDSGDGIAPDLRHRIFRPFFTTKADGSGIGLSLARQIIRAHDGELLLHYTMPTRFELRIPC